MPATPADSVASGGASRWTIALCALIGLGVGLVAFAFRTPTYEAQALVAVSNPIGSLTDEVDVVTSNNVLNAAASALGFEPQVTVTSAEVASLLTITAKDDDPAQAAAAANVVAETYVQAQLGAAANIAQVAQVPDNASGLSASVFAAIGTILGGLIGLLVSYLQQINPTRSRLSAEPNAAHPTQASTRPKPPPGLLPVTPTNLPASTPPSQPVVPMDSTPSSFSDAATSETDPALEGSWSPGSSTTEELANLNVLDRRAIQSQQESARYELVLAHEEQIARLTAEHERQTVDLRAEVANLTKQVRMQSARLSSRSGTDQTRVGDLEAQVDALEVELASLRQVLESERISHTRRLTEESGTADRALDNARRKYREELAKHLHTHRQALAEHRGDLDNELAEDRARHADALEEQHNKYERQLEAERERVTTKQVAADERHERELAALRATNQQALDRQATQHKETISSLRGAGENSDTHLRKVEKENRALRVEVASQQKQARHADTEHSALAQRQSDELSLTKTELEGERQRNAALRADVLRRSAEAHQAIDRAVEERTAQLAELEASVARQRQYADTRVREVSAAAEEQARQAATREASLTATASRLKRELEELKNSQPDD